MNTKEITDYIFLENNDPTGDIGFIFGTWIAWKPSVEKAAELYKNGFVSKLIVSGGLNQKSDIVEGEFMAKELEKLGVPKNDILIENKSTNTLENVVFSKEIIEREIGFENIKTVVGIVKNYHSRRALMTLRKHLPNGVILKASPYHSPNDLFRKDNWYKTNSGTQKINEEINKIKQYLDKGDIAKL